MEDNNYIKTKKIAIMITLAILILGSIAYFGTAIAARNNEMMYKDIFGDDAVFNNADGNIRSNNIEVDVNKTINTDANTKKALL